MPRNNDFDEWVMEQLERLPGIAARAMFGGRGLFAGDLFFGILYDGRLYFHTDVRTRPGYLAAGSEPFQPNPQQRLNNYYEVPAEVLDDAGRLTAWAMAAILTRKGEGGSRHPA